VDGQKVDRARLLGALDREDTDDASGLGHGFDHHHAWIYRALGKMPLERRFVDGDVLDADATVIAADIDHPINQKHGIAMRKRLEDTIDIDSLNDDRCVHQMRPSPTGSVAPPRAESASVNAVISASIDEGCRSKNVACAIPPVAVRPAGGLRT